MANKLTGIVKTGKDDFIVTPGIMAVGAVVVVLVAAALVVMFFTSGKSPRTTAAPPVVTSAAPVTVYRPTPLTRPTTTVIPVTTKPTPISSVPRTGTGPTVPYIVQGGPPPITANQYASPATMATLFTKTYLSWQSPASLTDASSRVENMLTPVLAAHFPAPTLVVEAPTCIASASAPQLVTSVGAVQVYSVPATLTLYAQDGRQFGDPVTEKVHLGLTKVAGKWLVDSFSAAPTSA